MPELIASDVTANEGSSPLGNDVYKLDRLLSQLYACVPNEQGFTKFLECLRQECSLITAAFVCVQETPFKGLYGWSSGYPRGLLTTLMKTNAVSKDDAVKKGLELEYGKPFCFSNSQEGYKLTDHLSPIAKSWAKPLGLIDSASIACSIKTNERYMLIINRHKDEGVFNAEDIEFLKLLEPHIRQAVSLRESLQHIHVESESVKAAIEDIEHATAIYSSLGKLMAANSNISSIAYKYKVFEIDEEKKQISFSDPELNQTFNAMLMVYYNQVPEESQKVEHLYVATQVKPLKMTLRPMLSKAGVVKSLIIQIKDPNTDINVTSSKISSLIKCSDAEACVLEQLVLGRSVEQAAENLNLATSSVREMITSVMSQNGYHRRVDLVTDLVRHFY